jgi:hypothetical protein
MTWLLAASVPSMTPIASLLTWNFASPDGHATFHLDKTDDGEPVLVWHRIGDHAIEEPELSATPCHDPCDDPCHAGGPTPAFRNYR